VEHSDTIDNVKSKIQEQEGTLQNLQGLIYSGKFLEGDRELWEYNIQDGSTLEFYLALSVPLPVLTFLSGKDNDIDERKESQSRDSNAIDFEFQFDINLDLDSSIVSRAERASESRRKYDPIKHQTQIEEILNKEIVSMISHDDSNLRDDASSIHEEIKEINNLEAERDASWGMVPSWY